MKAVSLKRQTRFDPINDIALGIQKWGERNDYPHTVIEIVNASSTGKPCVSTYAKFISGKGFKDTSLNKLIVNSKKQTIEYIEDLIAKDLAKIGGFALHFNYNLLGQITEVQHVPIEFCRFEKLDENYKFNRIAVHQDWGMRNQRLKRFRKEDIVFVNLFNPENVLNEINECGGIQNYNGQILYYSNQGDKTYPLPVYDNVITDMSTEEGVSNVSYRNARNNFLTSGMFIDKVNKTNSFGDSFNEDEKDYKEPTQLTDIQNNLIQLQGDEKACKILYVQVESDEEKPEFVSFKAENYDKEFTVTRDAVKSSIGGAFQQPPILRSENVANGLGAETMRNAYDFYNSITNNERIIIERIFTTVFKYWYVNNNYEFIISPLTYDVELTISQRIGDSGVNKIFDIVSNTNIGVESKKALIKTLYSLTDEEINSMIV